MSKYNAQDFEWGYDDYADYTYDDYYDNYGYDGGLTHYGQDDLHIRMQKSKRKKNEEKAKQDDFRRQKMQIKSLTATVQRFDDEFTSLKSKFEKTMVFKFPTDLEIILFLKGPVNIHYNKFSSSDTSGIENGPQLNESTDNKDNTNDNNNTNINTTNNSGLILRKKQLVEKASIEIRWDGENKEYLSQFRQLNHLKNSFKNLLTSVKNKIETINSTLKKDRGLMEKCSSQIEPKEKKLINLQKAIDLFITNDIEFLQNRLLKKKKLITRKNISKSNSNSNNNNNKNNKNTGGKDNNDNDISRDKKQKQREGNEKNNNTTNSKSNSKQSMVVLKRNHLVFDVGYPIKIHKITNLVNDHCKRKGDNNNKSLRWNLCSGPNSYPSYLDCDFCTDINIYNENEIKHYVECVIDCFLIGINENQRKEICFNKEINYRKINLLHYLFKYHNVPYAIGRIICQFGHFSNDCSVYTIQFNSKLNITDPKEFSSPLGNVLSLNWVLKRFGFKNNQRVLTRSNYKDYNYNYNYEIEEKTGVISKNNIKNSSMKPSMNRKLKGKNNKFDNDDSNNNDNDNNNCIAVIDAKETKKIMFAYYRDGITMKNIHFGSHSSDIFNNTDIQRFEQKQTIFTYLDKFHKFLQPKNHPMFEIEMKSLKEKEKPKENIDHEHDDNENDNENNNQTEKSEIEMQIEKEREIEFENYQFYKHLQKCLSLRVKKDKLKLHCKCNKSVCH